MAATRVCPESVRNGETEYCDQKIERKDYSGYSAFCSRCFAQTFTFIDFCEFTPDQQLYYLSLGYCIAIDMRKFTNDQKLFWMSKGAIPATPDNEKPQWSMGSDKLEIDEEIDETPKVALLRYMSGRNMQAAGTFKH